MPEQATDSGRRVVALAVDEARLLNHNYLGTEHLLLGLIREREGLAANALQGLGISLDEVREQVRAATGQGHLPSPEHVPFTPRAGEALALALREARTRGHEPADTEHILLGLTSLGGDTAAGELMTRLGVDVNDVRKAIIERLAV